MRPLRLARRGSAVSAAPPPSDSDLAPPAPERPAHRDARRWAEAVLPPLLAFLAANALLWHAAASAGHDFLNPGTWLLWDANHYLSQARQGLTLVPCKVPPYKPGSWCGNAGWFPLYPLVVRLVAVTGLPLAWSAVLVAKAACLAMLAVLWRLLGARPGVVALLCLALAAVFPGMVYDHAPFPISLAGLATLLCLHGLARRSWLAAGLAGAVAAASYPVGVLLLVVVPVWMAVAGRRAGPVAGQLGATLLVVGLVAAGFLAVLAFGRWQTGAWDAYFRVQAHYGNTGLRDPVRTLRQGVAPTPARPGRPGGRLAPRVQYVVVAVLLALGLAVVATRQLAGHAPPTSLEWAAALCALVFWLGQLAVGSAVHHYRGDALLVPVVLLVRHLHWAVQVVLVAVCGVLAWHMAVLFFQAILI
ncbi:MAG TPA: hypothetical protein VGM21_11570 [Actinomycetota bacterium]